MKLYNLKDDTQVVDFETAVKTGLGRNQGLFFPRTFPPHEDIDALLAMPIHERNFTIIRPFVSDNIDDDGLRDIIKNTYAFPASLKKVNANSHCLELFHGPTLAFKDFGANFMANCLSYFAQEKAITILTATSGDTGAAVAHAFYQRPNIRAVILFPKGKVSQLQQSMFTTLGENIHAFSVAGAFDDCQALVKQSFDDRDLVQTIGLNSANSINISRLLAQVCYYFDAYSQLPEDSRKEVVVAVPSGNFGNLCAGIIAKVLGLPIKRFIAATNLNDTVPRYLQTGEWTPKQTIATLSNAMDVSQPNNWPRIQYLIDSGQFDMEQLTGFAVDEQQTQASMLALQEDGYVSEPHAAVAYHALQHSLKPGETGIFLGTAHPAKFKSSVDEILHLDIDLPKALQESSARVDLATDLPADFSALEKALRAL
jgi:threonine synthase